MRKEILVEIEQKLKLVSGFQQFRDIVKNLKFCDDMVDLIELVKVMFGC